MSSGAVSSRSDAIRKGNGGEWISRTIFTASAVLVIVIMAAVFIFVGSHAYQTFTVDHRFSEFFGSANWRPLPDDGEHIGAQALIAGTVVTTLLALILAAPLSVGLAIFVTEIAPTWARRFMQPVLELLTGIPSVIFGFLGLIILVPWVREVITNLFGIGVSPGFGVIPAAILLTIMILPTITTLSIDALAALPVGLREGGLALGATRWQMISRTLVPAASAGIFTGIILGMGRALGETLAVALVIGGIPYQFFFKTFQFQPNFRLTSTSSITTQLLQDFRELTNQVGTDALWSLAFLLLLISFLLVVAGRWIAGRSVYNASASRRARGPTIGARALSMLARKGA
jgi:phosphate transport system permease protein